GESRARRRAQLPERGHLAAATREPGRLGYRRQRVRLERVEHLRPGGQGGEQRLRSTRDLVEIVDVQRRAETLDQASGEGRVDHRAVSSNPSRTLRSTLRFGVFGNSSTRCTW